MPHPYRVTRAELPAAPPRRAGSREMALSLLAVCALSVLRCVYAWIGGEAPLGEPSAAAAVALLALAGALHHARANRAR